MKNKKGFELLGEHTINIVIAVLCLLVLIYLGMALFGFFKDKQHLEQAKGTLNDISFSISSLKTEGKVGASKEVLVLSPSDWWINVFPENGKYPPSCQNKPCVCISKTPPWGAGTGSSIKFTDWDTPSGAICQTFENLNLDAYRKGIFNIGCKGYDFQITPPLSIKITLKDKNTIYFEEVC